MKDLMSIYELEVVKISTNFTLGKTHSIKPLTWLQ